MKPILSILAIALTTNLVNAAPPAVGSISTDQTFARESSSGFVETSLNDYEGKILILMMMTPWCPICQSHAQAVGNGLLDHFDDPSRASLRGKNNNGVPIQSILLSTEEAATWDNVNDSFSTTNGYDQWGLDADEKRRNARKLLGYYRGGFINSSNLYDWGNDRRRIVVLNMVNGSASHSFREIVINQNSYTSSNNAAARAAINAILPMAKPTVPLIELEHKGTKLRTREATVSFGKTLPGGSSTLAFTVRNGGAGNLTALAANLSGSQSADFMISEFKNDALAPDQTADFVITFKPEMIGSRRATLTLTSSVTGVTAFSVSLAGLSGFPAPDIEIQQPRETKLSDGKSIRSFGTSTVRKKGKSIAFRIRNTGDAPLTGLNLTKKGPNSGDFLVKNLRKTVLSSGASTTFDVIFLPRGPGKRATTLEVRSNDADESPFSIKVSGIGRP